MSKFFSGFFDCVKRNKGYCLILVLLSVVAIVLGIIAAINMDSIDLTQIAYIRFLRGSGFMSMMFGLLLSIFVFFVLICVCNFKAWLVPLAMVFYLYLVYSQTVVFLSIILIYGFFNCVILAVLLLIFSVLTWFLFLLIMCELPSCRHGDNYWKVCFSPRDCKICCYLVLLFALVLIFTIILSILKNYVLLLVFE